MLRIERYPNSRFWALWDGQDLVAVVVCVFHGILPPSPQESCHPVHGKVATQSAGKLPPSPWEFCHPVHDSVAPLGA